MPFQESSNQDLNTFEFISNLIDSLVWPLIVVIIVFRFKKSITNLIPRISKLKYRDFETDFQSLSISDQELLFLDGVARKEYWTFYSTSREEERELGSAFAMLVDDLLSVERLELFKKLKEWLASEDPYQMWFASEIIGYFRIEELNKELKSYLPVDYNSHLTKHELNILWANSRLNGDDELGNLLNSTKSYKNQEWLLFVFYQMYAEQEMDQQYVIDSLKAYLNSDNVSESNRAFANEIIKCIDESKTLEHFSSNQSTEKLSKKNKMDQV